jgi:hypothetical protein
MMMVLMMAAETVSMTAAELGIIEGCDVGALVPTMDRRLSSELHCELRGFTACEQ